MSSVVVAAFTISFFFLICQTGGKQLSTNLEKDLKLLKKPVIKTITTKYGDIFDCVDIYKQPSFDHPLLQNHTVQMKPSFVPEALSPHGSAQEASYPQFELEDGGCPDGYVPIRRTRKEDLSRIREHFKDSPSALIPDSELKPGWHFAGVIARKPHTPIKAARGLLNVYNPKVSNEQHSDSLVYIKIGKFETHNVIHAGWTVYPSVYGDTQTRLHTVWTADNYGKTGCIDIHCPGFVQVSKSVSLGAVITPGSQYGGQQYQMPIAISQDQMSHNWWLITSWNVMIGYWPKEIFMGLEYHGDVAGWGGRVYSPVGSSSPAPQMGSGHKSGEGFGKSCYVKQMQFVRGGQGVYEDLNADSLISHVDSPSCYDVKLQMSPQDRADIFFGGPGGAHCGQV